MVLTLVRSEYEGDGRCNFLLDRERSRLVISLRALSADPPYHSKVNRGQQQSYKTDKPHEVGGLDTSFFSGLPYLCLVIKQLYQIVDISD